MTKQLLIFEEQFPLLNQYLHPILKPLTPIIGYDDVLFQISASLEMTKMSNIVLIGEPGTGKSAIMQQLAFQHQSTLDVYEVSLSALHGVDGILSVTLPNLLMEVISYQKSHTHNKDLILWIDELHQLPMFSEAAVEAIKPLLARSAEYGIHIVGATTSAEYNSYIVKNAALETRFEPILIPELSRSVLLSILISQLPLYNLTCTKQIKALLLDVIKYTDLVLPAASQPRKSLKTLDMMYGWYKATKKDPNRADIKFDKDLLATILYNETGYQIDFNMNAKGFEDRLNERVYDQHAAVHTISGYGYTSKLNVQKKGSPRGIFLFVGPTGVGKTQLAKEFTWGLFGSEAAVEIIPMGDYPVDDPESFPKFLNHFTNTLKSAKTPLIVLDEIEKGNPTIATGLYTAFDDGWIFDEYRRKISVANVFIVMTTNLGEGTLEKYSDQDLTTEELEKEVRDLEKVIANDLKATANFPKAYLGRISAFIPFMPLSPDTYRKIAKRGINTMCKTFYDAQPDIRFKIDETQVLSFILDEKLDMNAGSGGARQINKIIERYILNKIAKPIAIEENNNRFYITMKGETVLNNTSQNKSGAYIDAVGRYVNTNVIFDMIDPYLQSIKESNLPVIIDKESLMSHLTVAPIDFSNLSKYNLDQTSVCIKQTELFILDLKKQLASAMQSKKILRCHFTQNTQIYANFSLEEPTIEELKLVSLTPRQLRPEF